MRKKIIILIPTAFVIVIIVLSALSLFRRTNPINTTDDPIDKLISNSLSIQYGTGNTNLDSVYTQEFIDGIDNNYNFYKEELAPYQITFKDYTLKATTESDYVVSVHIKDRNGSYIQVVHIIEANDRYLISEIEYDI